MIRTSVINDNHCYNIATAKISLTTSCINLNKMFKKAKKDLLVNLHSNSQKEILYSLEDNTVFSDKYMLQYILSFVHNPRKFKFILRCKDVCDQVILPVFKNLQIKSSEKFYLEDENIFLGKKCNTIDKTIMNNGYIIFEKKSSIDIEFDIVSIDKKIFSPFIKYDNLMINFINPKTGIYYSHNYKEFAVIGVSNYEYNLRSSFMKLVMLFFYYGKHESNIKLCIVDAIDWLRQHINVMQEYKLSDYDKQTLQDEINKVETVSEDSFTKDMLESFKKIVVTFN